MCGLAARLLEARHFPGRVPLSTPIHGLLKCRRAVVGAMHRDRHRSIDPSIAARIARLSDGVAVEGTAALPEATRLRCGLWRGGIEGPYTDIVYGWTDVHVGAFRWIVEGVHWSGEVSASVELRANASQPESTRRVIGDSGEHLAYSDTEGRAYRQLFVVVTAMLD